MQVEIVYKDHKAFFQIGYIDRKPREVSDILKDLDPELDMHWSTKVLGLMLYHLTVREGARICEVDLSITWGAYQKVQVADCIAPDDLARLTYPIFFANMSGASPEPAYLDETVRRLNMGLNWADQTKSAPGQVEVGKPHMQRILIETINRMAK